MGIVAIVVAQAKATADLEAVYREDGARLWRALYAYSNDAELAFDAAAEAFAQALGRGTAIRDVRNWVWRTAFRVAAGDLKSRPDGERILFTRRNATNYDEASLWSVNADGSDARLIVNGTGWGDWQPASMPDSR